MGSMIKWGLSLGIITALCGWAGRSVAGNVTGTGYETGYENIVRLSGDLHRALTAQNRQRLLSIPVLLEKVEVPFLHPSEFNDGSNRWRVVFISAGFVDLVNYLSHAKAIDQTQRGFLNHYVGVLSTETGAKPLTTAVSLQSNSRCWSLEIMNGQASAFNQMVGALIAIDMAHLYLGHYDKYASRLHDGENRAVPIASVITPAEWREALLKGARNALDCGLSVEGLVLLYESIDRMQVRPAWTVFFLPNDPAVQVSQVKKDLRRMEKAFFAGCRSGL
jgi:hypothetical protein